ncbi:MAG: type II toxin-antitoxin system ParD family antitoxin [Candidatus Lokiarchaeota archaeon]|nr:type II toxin-antitoxin system ParD family antitoxin [Candidatus Lokiarchaeota archaeon]
MKIITINLPEKYLEAIQTLNDLGIYPSRSEAIRTALSEFLDEELKMFNNLEEDTFKMIIRSNKNNKS